jgi:hypothetical protein
MRAASDSCQSPVNDYNQYLVQDYDDMEFMARKLKEEYKKWRFTMNLEKTKYICIEEEKESLKFDSGEEIKLSTECTYLGTKIDQTGNHTTEIKHRINQTREAFAYVIYTNITATSQARF